MADNFTKGFDDMERLIARLPEKMQRRAYKNMVRAGGRVFEKEMKRRAPIDDGDLEESIRVKDLRQALNPSVAVGSISGAPHAILVEFGTTLRTFEPRVVTISGNTVTIDNTGAMPATPFVRPAINDPQTRERALAKMAQTGGRALEREARRLRQGR